VRKPLLLLFLIALPAAAGYLLYPFALRAFFLVKGTAAIDPEFAERAARPNTMLFLVARNEGGVPVAVKKIINPVFPLDFQMTPSDIILPDVLTKKIYLEAFLNSHGELGEPRRGDLTGSVKKPVFIVSKGNSLTIAAQAK